MKTRLKITTVLALALGLSVQSHAADRAVDGTVHNLRAVDEYILPAYQQLGRATAALQQQTATFCAAPDEAGLEQLRQSYRDGMAAWQSVQQIRFGPIEYLTRAHRFQLWPDKRGTVRKHLAKLLAAQDSAALDADTFASGSVAVQGFSALERLLFGTNVSAGLFAADAAGRYRCQVVEAIGANLADMSAKLANEWPDQRSFIATAHGGNDFYDSDQEVSSKLLNNLHTQLQVIVEQKLERPLGSSLRKARGKRAESWRSEQSLDNIRHNLLASRALYATAFAPRLTDKVLHGEIEQAFARTLQAVAAVPVPLYLAVEDSAARAHVEVLRRQAGALKALLGTRLPQALDLPLGFNSLDGD